MDHFIPWSYVKDDKLWNFVLACPQCNEKKNNRIPTEMYLDMIIKRNEIIRDNTDLIVEVDFKNYDSLQLKRLWKYAQLSGMKKFSLGR